MSKQPANLKDNGVSKSWFCVLNNPQDHGYDGEPQDVVDKIIDEWMKNNPQRSCAVSYCISADGLKHCHAVVEDTKAMRFSAVKSLFPSMHIDQTKGSKEQAEDYINKRGKFAEQGEKVICTSRRGEIRARQGQRKDLEIIEELINQGKTPNEILDMAIEYWRNETIIRKVYYRRRDLETPSVREIKVYWHTGDSGTGKSYTRTKLEDERGIDNVFFVREYKNGFDRYNGQPTLFLDEFRGVGQLTYTRLLYLLDEQKGEVQARYSNSMTLWNEVHITSVYPPDIVYQNMVNDNKEIDTYEQLRRRINFVVYHYKAGDKFCEYQIPMSEYKDYNSLRNLVHSADINTTTPPADKPAPYVRGADPPAETAALDVKTEESPAKTPPKPKQPPKSGNKTAPAPAGKRKRKGVE